jgi:hypothetical protein
MTNEIIKSINDQGNDENQSEGLLFGDRNNLTAILDLEPCEEGEEANPEFDDDDASDRSYEPKDDDSELSNDHGMPSDQYDDEEADADGGINEDAGVDEDIMDIEGEPPPQEEIIVEQGIDDDQDAMLEELHEEDDPLLEDLHVIEDNDDNEEEDTTAERADKAPAKK